MIWSEGRHQEEEEKGFDACVVVGQRREGVGGGLATGDGANWEKATDCGEAAGSQSRDDRGRRLDVGIVRGG